MKIVKPVEKPASATTHEKVKLDLETTQKALAAAMGRIHKLESQLASAQAPVPQQIAPELPSADGCREAVTVLAARRGNLSSAGLAVLDWLEQRS